MKKPAMTSAVQNIINSGTGSLTEHQSKQVRIINSLCLLTSTLAFVIGNIFYLTTHLIEIQLPAMLEGLSFATIIVLNRYKCYRAASIGLLIVHCVFAMYFGIILGQTINLQLIGVFLFSVTFLIYEDPKLKAISIACTLLTVYLPELNFYFNWFEPIPMSRNNLFFIRWIAIASFLSFDAIVVLYYVNENKKHRKELERLIEKVKSANELIKTFVYKVTHELRNRLNPLALITINIKKDIKKDSQLQPIAPYTDQMAVTIMACKNIISNILSFAEIEAGKADRYAVITFRFRELIYPLIAIYQLSATEKGIRIITSIGEAVPDIIKSDTRILNSLLSNLLSNAVKYGIKNTSVIVRVSSSADTLSIAISNKSPEIRPEKQQVLFNRFETDKGNKNVESTGLGLYIVQNEIKTIQGGITMTSKDDTITFTLKLPLIPGDIKDITEEDTEEVELTHHDILIADDDRMSATLLGRILRNTGAKVSTVQDGYGVLEALQIQIPDIIILDAQMPEMNGLETLQQLKSNPAFKEIPVMIASGDELDPQTSRQYQSLGVTEFLLKPIEEPALIAALKRQISPKKGTLQEFG